MSPGKGNECHDDKGKFCSEGGSANTSRSERSRGDREKVKSREAPSFGVKASQHDPGLAHMAARGGIAQSGTPNVLSPTEQERALARLEQIKQLPDAVDQAGETGRRGPELTPEGLKAVGWSKLPEGLHVIGLARLRKNDKGEVTDLPVSAINRAQSHMPIGGLEAYIKAPPSDIPEVVRDLEGRYHVSSGHTRLTVQMLAGRSIARVRVYDMRNFKGKAPRY